MGNLVFPSLPGQVPGPKMTPTFKTRVQEAESGAERRATKMAYPKWRFSLDFSVLSSAVASLELQQLVGLFLACRGSWDSFLYSSPVDYAVTNMAFGTGTGVQTQFQLTRSFGASGMTFVEPVQNVQAVSAIKVNGVTKTAGTDYTIGATGLVTFTSAPANGAALTWSGTFYYRCRFQRDEAEFNQFLQDLWEHKNCAFVGSPMNKV